MIKAPRQRNTNVGKPEKTTKSSVSRLYRASVQLAQRLDILCKSTADWKELFQAETLGIRQKLKANCENLLFTNPKEFGRKAEELIWRKVFYDVIQWLRQQRKVSDGDIELESACRSHLLSASGYYFHLLLKLQQSYGIKLDGIVSWSSMVFKESSNDQDIEVKEWARKACQRCLLSLGDLARYQQEIEDVSKNIKLAERFYLEAFHINPDLGMPHNQLGTLLGGLFCGCEGVFHYMRCLMCKEVFDGTEGNLVRLFEKNRAVVMAMKELPVDATASDKVNRFLVYFVYLQDVLYARDSSQKVASEDIGQLCHSVLQDLETALDNSTLKELTHNHQDDAINGEATNGGHPVLDDMKSDIQLTGFLMVKVCGIMIMTLTRLKYQGSPEVQVATAFTLAFLSLLLQHCIASFESEPAKITNGKKNDDTTNNKHEKLEKVRKLKKAIKMRRRRPRKRHDLSTSLESCSLSDSDTLEIDSDNESDLSEGCADDINSDESDDVYVESDSEEESGSPPKSLFSKPSSACNGNSLTEAGKLLTQQILKDNLSSKNGVSFGKVSYLEGSDVSDVETESSLASWGRIEEFEELSVVRSLLNKHLLPSIKLMTDWLMANPDIIATCVESSSTLWSKMAALLNLLPSQEQLKTTASGKSPLWKGVVCQEMDTKWSQKFALPEDICMFGFEPLTAFYSSLQLQWIRPPREGRCIEAIIRTLCLRNFGMELARMKALNSFLWDDTTHSFMGPNHCIEQEKKETARTKQEAANRRSQVMKAMAHQRMKSEVRKLEKSLKSAPKGTTAYLVPDSPSLCSQLHLIRRLVTMEKFLIIIPIQVIEALDELKKFDAGARESIKYLEGEFKKGNRWIRAQKDNETVESSKKRGRYDDVAVWRFNQLVNCCRFLVNQTARGLVTLLTSDITPTGKPSKGRKGATQGTHATPETVEFARSCGINVESLRSFCAKYTSARSIT